MKDGDCTTALREERERRETALFDALGALLQLPHSETASVAGFAAGLMAAHLADVAVLENPADAAAARAALARLHGEIGELLVALAETGRDTMPAGGRGLP